MFINKFFTALSVLFSIVIVTSPFVFMAWWISIEPWIGFVMLMLFGPFIIIGLFCAALDTLERAMMR